MHTDYETVSRFIVPRACICLSLTLFFFLGLVTLCMLRENLVRHDPGKLNRAFGCNTGSHASFPPLSLHQNSFTQSFTTTFRFPLFLLPFPSCPEFRFAQVCVDLCDKSKSARRKSGRNSCRGREPNTLSMRFLAFGLARSSRSFTQPTHFLYP